MKEKPLNITANRARLDMTITWGDGHTSLYPFSLLRAACPCAQCRGGHEKMSPEPDPEIFYVQLEETPATRLANIKPTGAYGITLVWEDGHDYGIYNWHYLRAACPCPICRAPQRK
jgi:DUF971 family protein